MSARTEPAASAAQSLALLCFICLFFYRFGAANLEGLVNYPFWRDMGQTMSNADFIRLRELHLWKVYPLLVLPFGLEIIAATVLLRLGHPAVPRWMFVAIVALLLVAFLSTVFIQIPIQNQHTRSGYDRPGFDRLIATDLWLRKVPSLAEGLLAIRVLWRVITR